MGKIINTNFSERNYKRVGGGVSFEERPAQPSDFTKARGYDYAKAHADSPSTFDHEYPNWQAFADCFIMRRAIVSISGTQQCNSDEFMASEIEDYTNPDFINVKDFAAPGYRSHTIPNGKYLNTGMNFRDHGDSYTHVDVTYIQYREWKLVRLVSGKLPDPKGN